MRIGIDASHLLRPEKSGVETYTLNLLRGLLAIGDRPEVYLYAAGAERPTDADPLLAMADRARVTTAPRLWLRLRMPLWMGLDRVRVAHFPAGILPRWVPCSAVVTLYDLAALHYPELYDPRELQHYDELIPRSAHRSAVVLTISESTKRDLVRYWGVAPGKIVVTPLAAAPQFVPVRDAAHSMQERFGVSGPYVLACVGSGHPRKNLVAVVESLERLQQPSIRLVIVGGPTLDASAQAAIEQSSARDRIMLLGHVPEECLPTVYSGAALLCFPSLYEGFGLPVLEAMACGTPVVCSNASSLPEVAGSAAVMVEPESREALTEAMDAVLSDRHHREALSAAGIERARQFSWERTAGLTLDAYRKAAGE